MEPVDSHDVTRRKTALRAAFAGLFVVALAACAYAGSGRSAGGSLAQVRGGSTTLNKIKAKAMSGKPATRGPSSNIGQQIVLIGSNFDDNVSVEFTAFANSTFSVLPIKIQGKKVTVPVPAEVVTGGVRLLDPDSGNSSALTLQIVPKIDTLTPSEVAPGGRLLIDGSGFSPGTMVVFRGISTPVQPTIVSPTRVDIVVPAGAQTGKMSVVTNGGTSKPVKLVVTGSAEAPEPRANNRGGRRGRR